MKIKNILEKENYEYLLKNGILNICTLLAECEMQNIGAKPNSSIEIKKFNSIKSISISYTKPISKCL